MCHAERGGWPRPGGEMSAGAGSDENVLPRRIDEAEPSEHQLVRGSGLRNL